MPPTGFTGLVDLLDFALLTLKDHPENLSILLILAQTKEVNHDLED